MSDNDGMELQSGTGAEVDKACQSGGAGEIDHLAGHVGRGGDVELHDGLNLGNGVVVGEDLDVKARECEFQDCK